MNFDFIQLLLPEVVFGSLILVFFVADLFLGNKSTKTTLLFSTITVLAALTTAALAPQFGESPMLNVDQFSHSGRLLVLISTLFGLVLTHYFIRNHKFAYTEIYYVILVMALSAMILVHSSHFLMLFISLESVSICSYILCAARRNNENSTEVALKYFILGAFCSTFILYGIALTYGATGSLNLRVIGQNLGSLGELPALANIGLVMILAGFAFKLAVFPFHIWSPDVYEGVSAPFTAIFATIPKVAFFISLAQILRFSFLDFDSYWGALLATVAALSMLYGNFAALNQYKLKRLIAYSSIAHTGYMLIALLSLKGLGEMALVYYLIGYIFINFGFFGSMLILGKENEKEVLEVKDLSGVGRDNRLSGFGLAVIMLGYAGFPLTAGFIGKIHVFYSGVNSGFLVLTVIGVLSSLFSVFYYFKIIYSVMAGEQETKPLTLLSAQPILLRVSFWACVGLTLIIGVFPSLIFNLIF